MSHLVCLWSGWVGLASLSTGLSALASLRLAWPGLGKPGFASPGLASLRIALPGARLGLALSRLASPGLASAGLASPWLAWRLVWPCWGEMSRARQWLCEALGAIPNLPGCFEKKKVPGPRTGYSKPLPNWTPLPRPPLSGYNLRMLSYGTLHISQMWLRTKALRRASTHSK